MGSSGAGKTTLMDVIAGPTEIAVRRATGYCEQMDIHSEASTFREALTFSAFLRQDAAVPDSEKYDCVNECLELLDLSSIADRVIRGSSTEQMKRLTIGVELAAQPSVLFLDEPTSGLDARSAKHIMDATWILEVIGAGVGNVSNATDFVKLFTISTQARQLEITLDREGFTRPASSTPALAFDKKRAANNSTQAKFLIKRFFDIYWRTASYNLTRFFISIMLGIVFGIAYVGSEYSSYQNINSGLGMVFMTQNYMTFIVFSSVVPVSIQERASFYRERSAQTYNVIWYFIGATLVEIPYCFVETLLFVAIYYPMVGFSVASILVIMINYIWITFTGFNPPTASIPQGYRWLYHLTPHKYTYASLVAIVFGDCPSGNNGSELGCQQMTGTPPNLGSDITVAYFRQDTYYY
ncbi:pleiotropic drug resistance protein, putative [Phytophthora infestans T30-4]|nr:pleiotropic drug resistance protein, putative [Phytophthora infestans T30-4]EEY53015.1 pleiotropic drug resistance protein, putative [Phytophthora infestans T30-4]|eukprot:XP_002896143.1 pleiotropic drug resistance protein, putative [Phytophthora infestans T30-4]